MAFALLPSQIEHYQRCLAMLTTQGNLGYIDTSTMGCGKTYTTTAIAQALGLSLLVICPKTVKAVWNQVSSQAGISVIDIITYQSTASLRGHQPKHGFLKREEGHTSKGKQVSFFVATEKYQNHIKEGMLLVIDEMQGIRNHTNQFRAIYALLLSLLRDPKKSRFALLSATPFDKPLQAINLMKLIGILPEISLKTRGKKERDSRQRTLWSALLFYCKEKDPKETQRILETMDLDSFGDKIFYLFTHFIKPRWCSAMPLEITSPCDARNGYYKIEGKEKEQLEAGIFDLEDVVIHVRDPVKYLSRGDYRRLTKARVKIETAKIPLFARVTSDHLTQDPTCKVVVCVHFLSTLSALETALSSFHPLILYGKKTEKEREQIIERFQKGENRLLLCITKVGGVGISLHDTVGTHPRVMLLSPDFNMIDIYQATGRVYRVGTQSPVTIRFVYGDCGKQETKILHVLAAKSETLKKILEERTLQHIVLPSDYESYIEE